MQAQTEFAFLTEHQNLGNFVRACEVKVVRGENLEGGIELMGAVRFDIRLRYGQVKEVLATLGFPQEIILDLKLSPVAHAQTWGSVCTVLRGVGDGWCVAKQLKP